MRHEARARADGNFRADDTVGPDFGAVGNLGFRVNDSGGVNGHDSNAARLRSRRFGGFVTFGFGLGRGEDQFAHQRRFGDDLAVDRSRALHLGDRVFQAQQLHFNAQLIAWHDRPAKARFFDGREEHHLAARVRSDITDQDASYLRHRFDNQHARHNRIAGKVAYEMRLVDRDVLDSNHGFIGDLYDSVHHQHGITMRQKGGNFLTFQRGHENRYYNNR